MTTPTVTTTNPHPPFSLTAENPTPNETLSVDRNLSGAENDKEIATLWLAVKSSRSKNTETAYRKELQRFFMWLDYHRLSLRSLNVVHAQQYLSDITQPDRLPTEWVCSWMDNKDARWNALSAKSANYTRRVLANLFDYANAAGYLRGNVMKLAAPANEIVADSGAGSIENYLEPDTWEWLSSWLDSRVAPNSEKGILYERDKWLVSLLYHTGIRREEAATARLKDVTFDKRHRMWRLSILGKGNKARRVTMNSACIKALRHFLECIGADMQSDIPLIPKLRGKGKKDGHVTPRFIGMTIQSIRDAAAAECPPEHREKLQGMSTHWLRHTNATHRLAFGAALETTQAELGHASINTTRIYAADTLEKRRDAAEVLVKKKPA